LIQCDTQKFNYRVPTLLITKNSRTFQDHQNVFPGPSRSAIPGCKAYGTPNILKFVIIVVYFEPPVNSSTIEDHFPVLSRTLSFHFQDFPGPGKSRTFQGLENPGLSRMCGNPVNISNTQVCPTGAFEFAFLLVSGLELDLQKWQRKSGWCKVSKKGQDKPGLEFQQENRPCQKIN